MPDDKKEKFITLHENILASKSIDVRTLQRFAGKCISFNLAIPAARLYARQVNIAISFCLKNSRSVDIKGPLREEIEYWRFLDNCKCFACWRLEFHKHLLLATDSSSFRYDAKVLSSDSEGAVFGDYWETSDIWKKQMLC